MSPMAKASSGNAFRRVIMKLEQRIFSAVETAVIFLMKLNPSVVLCLILHIWKASSERMNHILQVGEHINPLETLILMVLRRLTAQNTIRLFWIYTSRQEKRLFGYLKGQESSSSNVKMK